MSSPSLALQQAMRTKLLAHAPLTTLLGGAFIFDEKPLGTPPPHVRFEDIDTRDWSVKDQKAHEHVVMLAVSSRESNRQRLADIVDQIEAALDDQPLTMTGHRLINLRLLFAVITRDGARLRFRAATEPNP
jgi:hypothetical protein